MENGWSTQFTTDFLAMYRANPCLWKISDKVYLNRNKKNEAYRQLVDFCKTQFPEANRDFVVKKIQSLRGSFRKELKKVNLSKRSGASSDDVYTPSLWYFNLLLFTSDCETASDSIDNTNNGEDAGPQEVINIQVSEKVFTSALYNTI